MYLSCGILNFLLYIYDTNLHESFLPRLIRFFQRNAEGKTKENIFSLGYTGRNEFFKIYKIAKLITSGENTKLAVFKVI